MKKISQLVGFSFILSLMTFTLCAQEHQLVKKWETDSLMKVPESVLYDAANHVLYVSNIDGQPWEKDDKGSIGKVGLDGKIIAVDWVSGLNAPKGMALYDKKLYVADMAQLAVIDIKKGAIIQWIPVEGAEGLNDVTVDPTGVVYVSDSRIKKVYRVENGVASVYLDNLKGPNGVLIHDHALYVLDNGGLYKVENDKSLKMIADGMEGGTDGVENVAGNDFIVSAWGGVVYYVKGDGTKEKLLDSREKKINSADIGYDAKNRIVYVPTFWKNSVAAYGVK
jgi:hypothetical protein